MKSITYLNHNMNIIALFALVLLTTISPSTSSVSFNTSTAKRFSGTGVSTQNRQSSSTIAFSFASHRGGDKQKVERVVQDTKINTTKEMIAKHIIKPIVIPLAITSAAAAVSTTLVPTASAASIESGQVLFTQNCASCHLNGENIMNPKRNLKKETLLKYFGSADGSSIVETEPIVNWIGKSGQHKRLFFPNVPGGRLSTENYEDAISFIVDQANNDKW
jgi:hypothetical protein